MFFTAWQKMNPTVRHITLAAAFGIAILVGYLLMTNRPDMDLAVVNAITILVAGAGTIASRFIAIYFGKVWSRVLPFQPHQLEQHLRLLFSDNNITFDKNSDDARAYSYEFPDEGVSMTIKSHKQPPTTVFDKEKKERISKITLTGISGENRSFVTKLAKSIDAMAKEKVK